jgi:hypothetical protein
MLEFLRKRPQRLPHRLDVRVELDQFVLVEAAQPGRDSLQFA